MGVFVGRGAELGALVEVAEQATSGPAGAVVIGEPGSGKSRLLAEAGRRIRLDHSLAVVGYEPARAVPLGAASHLLRQLFRVPDEGPRLESLLFAGEAPTGLDRLRLFETSHRAFRQLEPVLLIVDDLHWIDELSLALCHYLVRAARETGQRLALLAATRPVEAGAALVEPLNPERVRVIELPPLSANEAVELATALDESLDRRQAEALHRLARGSPFWIEALAGAGGSPLGATDIITTRLRTAPADAGEVLQVLAVAGRPMASEELSAVVGWPVERAHSSTRDLAMRGLATTAAGRVGTSHDLIRNSALANIPEEIRRGLHARLAFHLETSTGDDVAVLREALEHRRAAGLPPLELAARLATSPGRSLLGPEGIELLAEIADGAGASDPAAVIVHQAVAELSAQIGRHQESLDRWLWVAEASDPGEVRARALLAASRAAFTLERPGEAREYLDASRRERTTDPVLALEQRNHYAAIALWLERRTDEGRTLVAEAVASAEELVARFGDLAALGEAERTVYLETLRLQFEAAVQEADGEAALQIAEQREAVSRDADPESHLSASLAVGLALRQMGRLHESTARFRRVWAQTHREVLPRLAVDAGYALARSLHLTGALREAEGVVGQTSALATRVGDLPRGRHRVVLAACGIRLERGPPREALTKLERETANEPNDHLRIPFHRDVALWTARLAGPEGKDQVHLHLEAGHRCVETASCPRCAAELLLFSAEALARVGEQGEARRALDEWRALGIHEDALHPLLVAHSAALAERDPGARSGALEEALAAVDGSPYATHSLWVRLDLGGSLVDVDRTRAISSLEAVAEEASARGAGTVRDLAARALRQAGVRTWRRRSEGAPLTTREQEVAGLVAEGATNREIAQALFLSPKTVERHVSNLFRKLGVRNRTELAARLKRPEDAGDPR